MPTHLVNLDALIQREEFETGSVANQSSLGKELKIDELEKERNMFLSIRKPDFQRETSNWDGERICSFIESFLDGELIPSPIMWKSPHTGHVFVIDGAHRISALAAWVHDDYGAGHVSQSRVQYGIPLEQKRKGSAAQKLINERVGSYQELTDILKGALPTADDKKGNVPPIFLLQ